jgi:tryptophanyl-tRNA synthetase
LEAGFTGKGYGDLKSDLAEAFSAFVRPVQAAVSEYLRDPGELDRVLALGAERARSVADVTVASAYDKIGFVARVR